MQILPVFPRFVRDRIAVALDDTPVVLIQGARQTGKTTLARSIGVARGYSYLSFDLEGAARAAREDPSGFIASLPERVILDEVGRVPELFAEIKHSVDQHRQPGRFILTGSTNVLLSPRLSESLAGRMEVVRLRPLAQAEIEGNRPQLLRRFFDGDFTVDTPPAGSSDLLQRIVGGGYPAALQRASAQRREQWYNDYAQALTTKDVQDLGAVRDLEAMPRLLRMIASQTAGLLNISDLSSPFNLSRPTIERYAAMLEQLFLIERLESWHANRSQRIVKSPKLHLADTGLACALIGVDVDGLIADDHLRGRITESFVHQELRRHAAWGDRPLSLYHFRTRDRVEVDIVVERRDGAIVGVEVKSSGTPKAKDFDGLRKLAEIAQGHMKTGILLYNGTSTLPFGENLFAVPIQRLWETGQKADG